MNRTLFTQKGKCYTHTGESITFVFSIEDDNYEQMESETIGITEQVGQVPYQYSADIRHFLLVSLKFYHLSYCDD